MSVPRQIDNCPYEQGEQIIITYKREKASDRKPQTYLEAQTMTFSRWR